MESDAPPSSSSPTPSTPKRRGWFRRLLRWSLVALLLLLITTFLARRQIGAVLAENLDARLAAAGIYIKWETASWIPGPGIRLKEVEVFRDAAKTDRIFLLGNVAAIKAEPGWSRWDTFKVEARDADLVLDHGPNETKLSALQLDLLIQPGKATLDRLEGDLLGWRVQAKGDYLNPDTSKPATPEEEPAKKEEGVLRGLKLDWLASVRDWATVQPGQERPVLKLEFHSVPETGATTMAVDLQGKSLQWRGQPWDSVSAKINGSFGSETKPITFDHIEIGHGGRTARMAGNYDIAKNALRVSEFESGVDLLSLARAFARESAAGFAPWSTTGDWQITGAGHIPLDQPKSAVWQGRLALTGEVTYAEAQKRVTLLRPMMDVDMSQGQVHLREFNTSVWGGQLNVPAGTIHLGEGDTRPTFETRARLSGASLQGMSRSFGSGSSQPGVVTVDWKGGGGFALPAMKGSGSVSIQRAEFYRVPLLGPLHLLFDQLTPGFGRDVATSLTASHSMRDGVLYIRNLKLDSKFTRIEANGTLNLTTNYAHLTAKGKLQGIAGLATALLTAMLEMEGEGPISNVHWKLKSAPAGLVLGAVDVVGKTGGVVLDGTGKVLDVTGDAAKGTIKETGKAVKGILKLPGKLLPKR